MSPLISKVFKFQPWCMLRGVIRIGPARLVTILQGLRSFGMYVEDHSEMGSGAIFLAALIGICACERHNRKMIEAKSTYFYTNTLKFGKTLLVSSLNQIL